VERTTAGDVGAAADIVRQRRERGQAVLDSDTHGHGAPCWIWVMKKGRATMDCARRCVQTCEARRVTVRGPWERS
jgi:hypothetical protein